MHIRDVPQLHSCIWWNPIKHFKNRFIWFILTLRYCFWTHASFSWFGTLRPHDSFPVNDTFLECDSFKLYDTVHKYDSFGSNGTLIKGGSFAPVVTFEGDDSF